MPNQQQKIIYIAGYGRSGSTLLDTILSAHPELEGVGEIKYLFQEIIDGKELPEVWHPVMEDFKNQVPFSIAEANRITKKAQSPFSPVSAKTKADYKQIWTPILQSLQKKFPDSIFIDSSKSASDAFKRPLLLREMGYDVHVIHLIRSPKDVMISLGKKGSNRLLEKGKAGKEAILTGGSMRALINWTWINLGVSWIYTRYHGLKTYALKYEDLINHTATCLDEIAQFVGVDAAPFREIEEGKELAPGIGISGNRMRRVAKIYIQKKNLAPQHSLSLLEKLGLFLILPVRRLFNY